MKIILIIAGIAIVALSMAISCVLWIDYQSNKLRTHTAIREMMKNNLFIYNRDTYSFFILRKAKFRRGPRIHIEPELMDDISAFLELISADISRTRFVNNALKHHMAFYRPYINEIIERKP